MKILLAAIVLCAGTASGGHQPRTMPPGEEGPKVSERGCDERITRVVADVSPAVVRILYGEGDMITGTIISADGLVLTCAHLPVPAGQAVTIGLSDGRELPAKVLSKLPREGEPRTCKDVALLQLADKGPFPWARMGASSPKETGGTFLALGFPDTRLYGPDRKADPMYVRIGEQIENPYATCGDELCTSIRGTGGDSGGPLFDLAGRIVGVVHSGDPSGAHVTYTRIEVVRRNWAELALGLVEPPSDASGPPVPTCVMNPPGALAALRSSVVEVYSRTRLAALGTVVGDGLVLTKASELGPSLTVVTPADFVGIAEVAATDPDLDLALLRLTYAPELTRGVPALSWKGGGKVASGGLLWSAGSATVTSRSGVACFEPRDVPPMRGFIPCEFEQGEGGVRVTAIVDALRRFRLRPLAMPLRAGDTLLAVEGVEVSRLEDYRRLMFRSERIGAIPPVAGQPCRITFKRGEETLEDVIGLEFSETPSGQLVRPASARYSSFRGAIATDLPALPEHCGTPVVDAEGRLVGMMIARGPFVETLVVPADLVAESLARMKASLSGAP